MFTSIITSMFPMSYIFNHIYSKNKDSIISMDNAGWSISKHSQNYMDCLTANFNQRVISLKTDPVWARWLFFFGVI